MYSRKSIFIFVMTFTAMMGCSTTSPLSGDNGRSAETLSPSAQGQAQSQPPNRPSPSRSPSSEGRDVSVTASATNKRLEKTDESLAGGEAPSPQNFYLTEIHQLTFAGSRAGEGYFSRDGRYMIFQSEREKDNPFYQMYVMDLKTGAAHRVSPGYGKTTCGWIEPGNKHVLFASTHADPDWRKKAEFELSQRKNPKQRYSWNFDDHYDIYQADLDGQHLKNLTHTHGYNAEGSYSPDGQWIVFASNRAAYNGTMSAEDSAHFAKDPSYMMDIYIMRADGSDVKRLTTDRGYDGGPFFSPDGKRITYRRFSPDGKIAEVYTMNADGGDQIQITRLGAMSWAPFYHPSGDYLIFTSNKPGFHNFELFIVDSEGSQEPIRVTDLEGFDGLPVFTPDGRSLVWAHTSESGETQLHQAEWNDQLARQALHLPPRKPQLQNLSQAGALTPTNVKLWVEYLTHPYFEGRATGSAHETEYVNLLAETFKGFGLKPGVVDGSFIQTYEFTNGLELGQGNKFSLTVSGKARDLTVNTDWLPLSFSKVGHFNGTPLVFAGYGLVAAGIANQPGYDSYAGADVKGKWAVVFADLPSGISNDRRFFLHLYSKVQHKAMMARQRGAAGLILVDDSDGLTTPELSLAFEGRNEDSGLPVIRLSRDAADELFTLAHTTRKEWTKKLAGGETSHFDFPAQVSARADVDLTFTKSTAHNVLGLLEVPGATQTVIVGAHLDHLGHGEMGNSLSPAKGAIHPGADDNASGVAGVMAVARDMAEKVKTRALQLKQNVLFALWTGEEIGILGSSYFSDENSKTANLKTNNGTAVNGGTGLPYKLSASLNMDMIGRYRDHLLVQGAGSAKQWKSLIERVAQQSQALAQAERTKALNVQVQEDPYLPSDAMTFYLKQIPSIMLFTGSHAQYHTAEDKPELINYEGLSKVADFAEKMTVALAAAEKSPVTYEKVEADPRTHPNRGLRLYLGTIPDYSRELKHGVAISGTTKGSPSERAGLQAGDVIVELGGMKIENIYDYVYCLQALKANEKTRIRVVRAGQEKDLEVTPQAKAQ